jgi:hypothetical protein
MDSASMGSFFRLCCPKAEAIRMATEFMELHHKHWPELEGESEVRPMFEPGMGP